MFSVRVNPIKTTTKRPVGGFIVVPTTGKDHRVDATKRDFSYHRRT